MQELEYTKVRGVRDNAEYNQELLHSLHEKVDELVKAVNQLIQFRKEQNEALWKK